MRKVLFFLLSDMIGGGERYAITLINALLKNTFSVKVLILAGSLEKYLKNYDYVILPFGKPLAKYRGLSLHFDLLLKNKFIKNLKPHFQQYNPELIFMQYLKEKILFTEYFSKMGVPILWTEHGVLPFWITKNPVLKYYYLKNAAKPQKIIAISKQGKDSLINIGVTEDKIELIYNGIDTCKFKPDLKAKDSIYIGTISSLTESKGISDFIKFAEYLFLSELKNKIKIEIAGKGPLENSILRLVSKYNDRVKFYGFIDNPEDIISKWDIFINPSRGMGEGLPFRVLEAMACGLIVVSTETGAVNEVIKDGFNGFLIKPQKIDSWLQLIKQIVSSIEKYNFLKKNAENTIKNNFSEKIMLDKTLKVFYESCISH
ncbi:MAG: glycosyltransferase family 4 protein [Candidatus Hydrogenedentota bacterium]